MEKGKNNITEAELEIIKVLWKTNEPMTAQQVSDALKNKKWKYSTIATLFSRMVDKGTVTYEKKGRFFYYIPAVDEKEYKAHETKNFISNLYNGSVRNLVASLVESNQMSEDDIDEIRKLFELED